MIIDSEGQLFIGNHWFITLIDFYKVCDFPLLSIHSSSPGSPLLFSHDVVESDNDHQ
jgi:hypothetical protein